MRVLIEGRCDYDCETTYKQATESFDDDLNIKQIEQIIGSFIEVQFESLYERLMWETFKIENDNDAIQFSQKFTHSDNGDYVTVEYTFPESGDRPTEATCEFMISTLTPIKVEGDKEIAWEL